MRETLCIGNDDTKNTNAFTLQLSSFCASCILLIYLFTFYYLSFIIYYLFYLFIIYSFIIYRFINIFIY